MKRIKTIGAILLGNFCVAASTVFFVVPGGFISGGATGLALALEAFFHIPISAGLAIICAALLVTGWIALGKAFAFNSLLSTVTFPGFVWVCEEFVKRVPMTTDNLFLNLAGAVLLLGYGTALVMRNGASTGGLDTLSVILYQKKGIPLALTVNLFEILTMLTQVSYSTTEEIMGGVLVTIFYTAVMNHFLAKGVARVQVMVYSQHYEQILQYVDTTLKRGTTLFRMQGGYRREDSFALQTVISGRELFQLKEEILRIDPTAFVTVSEVSEVSGKGFTLDSDVPGDRHT